MGVLRPAVVVLILVAIMGDHAVTVSKADEVICNMTQQGIDACKPSVSGSDPTPPSKKCCSALAAADLPCLCSYRNSYLLPAYGIDPDLALQLPAKCHLALPAEC
ncbi:putative lipid-transfer protein DIR1 [Typha latifolia]|uniref:putative lipid-transfer protein DIR1 n=1 Tax=Typha latifolia TaxID=4733 RepID=UPI003C2EFEDA